MIITTIKIHGLKQKRKEIFQTLTELVDEMPAKQAGCLRANLYEDLENKDIHYLMEEWATRKDLEDYRKSGSLAVLLGLEALLVEEIDIKHAVLCKLASNKKGRRGEIKGGAKGHGKNNS